MALNVEDDACYIIGIDFGTTYSGVAWCWSGQPDNIQIVTRWKDRLLGNTENSKVPTQLHYGSSNSTPSWGYDIPVEVENPIRWFKLLLQEQPERAAGQAEAQTKEQEDLLRSLKIDQAANLAAVEKKTAVQLVADYLSRLWWHTIDEMERDRGKAAVTGLPFKVWITIPAIWSEDAQQRMRQAAELAGISARRLAGPTTIDFVAEPEAAALAVFDDFKGRPDVQIGDAFVVCDAGGGTVDLISYRVTNMDPMTVEECVEGEGKMCGAIFLDEAFEGMLRNSLNNKWSRLNPESRKNILNKDWEHGIKRGFTDQEKIWNVTIPPEANSNQIASVFRPKGRQLGGPKPDVPSRNGYLKFERNHIRTIFAHVRADMLTLLHKQVEGVEKKIGKPPKAIMMVGGLGSCSYMFHEIQKEFERQRITIYQPAGARPWTAICRGAVIRGLGDAKIKFDHISSRISRVNYGIAYRSPWKDGLFDQTDKLWDESELAWKADNQMRWYLMKGDNVSAERPMEWSFYRLFRNPQELKQKFEISLYRNRDEIAPTRKTDSVKLLQRIPVDVEQQYEEIEEFVNDQGKAFRKLQFNIQMSSTGVSMIWRIKVGDKIRGEKNLKVELEEEGNVHDFLENL